MIKNRLIHKLYTRLECGLKWRGPICPKIQKKLKKLKGFLDNYYAKTDSGIDACMQAKCSTSQTFYFFSTEKLLRKN